jgi:hypothetical protein
MTKSILKMEIDLQAGRALALAASGIWLVEAVWTGVDGQLEPNQGAGEIRIFPSARATKADKVRGLNSGVLRPIESLVAYMNAEFTKGLKVMTDGPSPEFMADRAIKKIKGKTPRSTQHYYMFLLQALRYHEATGSKRPIQDMAESLELKPETVKTQVRAARKWQAAKDKDREEGRSE